MASISRSALAFAGREAERPASAPAEILEAIARRRLQAALEQLAFRDDIPEALRQAPRVRRYTRRPKVELGTLLRSWSLYRQTLAELRGRGPALLADIGIAPQDVPAVAFVACFGWLQAVPETEGTYLDRLKQAFAQFRATVAPTEAELDEAYLAQSRDIIDLEYRIAELDRRRRPARHSMHSSAAR
jgi:uncharacterized protein YjiS (DUF1127 family)